jgi:hypothetical protein
LIEPHHTQAATGPLKRIRRSAVTANHTAYLENFSKTTVNSNVASYGSTSYPPPPMTRSRGSSTTSRYTPDAYKTPDQLAQPPMSNGYPFPNGVSPQRPSPLTSMQSQGPLPGQMIPPQNTLHPAAAANPPYPTGDRELPMPSRPYDEMERRHSASSQHSRRSHDSHRSRDSHRSHKSHHSHRTSSEEPEKRHRHHERERRRSDSYYDKKPVKRADTHRPTIGDSIFSLFGTLKGALGPRDKY